MCVYIYIYINVYNFHLFQPPYLFFSHIHQSKKVHVKYLYMTYILNFLAYPSHEKQIKKEREVQNFQ